MQSPDLVKGMEASKNVESVSHMMESFQVMQNNTQSSEKKSKRDQLSDIFSSHVVEPKYYHQVVRQKFSLTPSLANERALIKQQEERQRQIFSKGDPDYQSALQQLDYLRAKMISREGLPQRIQNTQYVDGMIKDLRKKMENTKTNQIIEALKSGESPREILKNQKRQEFSRPQLKIYDIQQMTLKANLEKEFVDNAQKLVTTNQNPFKPNFVDKIIN